MKNLRVDQLREMRRFIERMVCCKDVPLVIEKRSSFSFVSSVDEDTLATAQRKRSSEKRHVKSKRARLSNSFMDDEAEVSSDESDEEIESENEADR